MNFKKGQVILHSHHNKLVESEILDTSESGKIKIVLHGHDTWLDPKTLKSVEIIKEVVDVDDKKKKKKARE